MKVAIFGSCVTRDAAEFFSPEISVSQYVARSSLVSAFHPTPVKVDKFDLDRIEASQFEKRMIAHDFAKSGVSALVDGCPDALVVDFIDERFKLYEYKKSLITLSANLAKSELGISIRSSGRPVAKDEKFLRSFDECVAKLVHLAKVRRIPVFLHEAYWSHTPLTEEKTVFSNNQMMSRLNESLKTRIPAENVICVDRRIADPNHKWGPSPFHFEKSYYEEISRRLYAVLKGDNKATAD